MFWDPMFQYVSGLVGAPPDQLKVSTYMPMSELTTAHILFHPVVPAGLTLRPATCKPPQHRSLVLDRCFWIFLATSSRALLGRPTPLDILLWDVSHRRILE